MSGEGGETGRAPTRRPARARSSATSCLLLPRRGERLCYRQCIGLHDVRRHGCNGHSTRNFLPLVPTASHPSPGTAALSCTPTPARWTWARWRRWRRGLRGLRVWPTTTACWVRGTCSTSRPAGGTTSSPPRPASPSASGGTEPPPGSAVGPPQQKQADGDPCARCRARAQPALQPPATGARVLRTRPQAASPSRPLLLAHASAELTQRPHVLAQRRRERLDAAVQVGGPRSDQRERQWPRQAGCAPAPEPSPPIFPGHPPTHSRPCNSTTWSSTG